VVEDGQSLHDSSYLMSPELQSRLRLVYSQASTSLALMAAAAKGYGRHSSSNSKRKQAHQQQQQQQGYDKDVEQGSSSGGGAAGRPFCGCVGAFGRSWAAAKEELAAFMLVRGGGCTAYLGSRWRKLPCDILHKLSMSRKACVLQSWQTSCS
jgi:hypothetical protein